MDYDLWTYNYCCLSHCLSLYCKRRWRHHKQQNKTRSGKSSATTQDELKHCGTHLHTYMICSGISWSSLCRRCRCDTDRNSNTLWKGKNQHHKAHFKYNFQILYAAWHHPKSEYPKHMEMTAVLYNIYTEELMNLFTSSADWAMKKPWVVCSTLTNDPGLIAMLASDPLSRFVSIAIRRSFSRMKHNLCNNQMQVTWSVSHKV